MRTYVTALINLLFFHQCDRQFVYRPNDYRVHISEKPVPLVTSHQKPHQKPPQKKK